LLTRAVGDTLGFMSSYYLHGYQLMEIARVLINGAKQHMGINIAGYIKHRSTNTANFLVGIHKHFSENIKFKFVHFFDCPSRNCTFKLKRSRYSSQADLFFLPSFVKLDSGNRSFSGICFRNFLRAVPKSFGWMLGIHNNNLLLLRQL